MSHEAWDSVNLVDLSVLPRDLTPSGRRNDRCFRATAAFSPVGSFGCTRIAGHTGRHAAGDGQHVRAVWPRGHVGFVEVVTDLSVRGEELRLHLDPLTILDFWARCAGGS